MVFICKRYQGSMVERLSAYVVKYCKRKGYLDKVDPKIEALINTRDGYVSRDDDGSVSLWSYGNFQRVSRLPRLWDLDSTVRISAPGKGRKSELFVIAMNWQDYTVHVFNFEAAAETHLKWQKTFSPVRDTGIVPPQIKEDSKNTFMSVADGDYVWFQFPVAPKINSTTVYNWRTGQLVWSVEKYRHWMTNVCSFFTCNSCLALWTSHIFHIYDLNKKTTQSYGSLADSQNVPIQVGDNFILYLTGSGGYNTKIHKLDLHSLEQEHSSVYDNKAGSGIGLQQVTSLRTLGAKTFVMCITCGDGPAPECPGDWQALNIYDVDNILVPVRTIELPEPSPYTFWRVIVAEGGRSMVCVPEDQEHDPVQIVSLLKKR